MRWLLALGVIVVAALGCGGDDELTVADYREQVLDAIGKADTDGLSRLIDDVGRQPVLLTNEQWKQDVRAVLDTWHTPLEEAREIDPPAEAEEVHRDVLVAFECFSDAADAFADAVEREQLAALSGSTATVAACMTTLRDTLDEVRALD